MIVCNCVHNLHVGRFARLNFFTIACVTFSKEKVRQLVILLFVKGASPRLRCLRSHRILGCSISAAGNAFSVLIRSAGVRISKLCVFTAAVPRDIFVALVRPSVVSGYVSITKAR
jgi:hypothetical protein